MAEITTPVAIPAADVGRRRTFRLARWLSSDRIFPLIPFVLVEGLIILTVLVPFALTIWISLLKWRANRPFETARFTGLENYAAVLATDQFWFALGRTLIAGRSTSCLLPSSSISGLILGSTGFRIPSPHSGRSSSLTCGSGHR